MSLFDSLKPKWKHEDPQVRLAAVSQIKDQTLLAKIADKDGNETVRLAAIAAMTDRETITLFAVNAESPRVREGAVNRMDDDTMLQRISAIDTNIWVRTRAKTKSTNPFGMLAQLRSALSKLPLSTGAGQPASFFSGTLDEMGKTLMEDRRFFINGHVGEHDELVTGSIAEGTASPMPMPKAPGEVLRLVAVRRNEKGEPADNSVRPVLVEVTICRTAPDAFSASMRERALVASREAVNRARARDTQLGEATIAEGLLPGT